MSDDCEANQFRTPRRLRLVQFKDFYNTKHVTIIALIVLDIIQSSQFFLSGY